ncbi:MULTISPECIES: DUF5412 family protein [Pontibacillus]|uniref:DUF5412 domain-containing protein n=1 Tax=Pontibacillus chungwhensis TaxID=265426 RepID=A0ABY8V069_9BACI|nr:MULTISPECIES: hypothetical protein [Pontibacillus]MCD5324532.1 hypothetical protein [Pontibacillus sp. HN14]WIF99172.1 hypothetical protein QNI29_05810 [Pontibacillus chungwhensis]
MKKYITILVLIPLILLGLYTFAVMFRGPFGFEEMPIDKLEQVAEYESKEGEYTIRILEKGGAPINKEWTYIGALYEGDTFVRNVIWIEEEVPLEWTGEETITFTNAEGEEVDVNVIEDTYDFRGFPL